MEIGLRMRQAKYDLVIMDHLNMLQQCLHECDLSRHRLTAHMALQGMNDVLSGECATAKVPLDTPPEVECPRLAVGTHVPVGGPHRHKPMPVAFFHQVLRY